MNYISRFILWTGLCSVLLTAGGCRKHDLDSASLEKKYPLVDAMLILRCNEMQTKTATREEQERQVNDLNLFFVHKAYPSPSAPEVRHYYFSSVDVSKHIKLTNIRLGEYRLYAVANAGRSLCPETSHDPAAAPADLDVAFCSMTEDEIKAIVVSKEESDLTKADNLLMSSVSPTADPNNPYCGEVVIKRGDEGVLPTFTINLVRRVAKVELSYELFGDAVGNLTINYIAAQSVAQNNIPLFKKEGNRPTAASDFNPYIRNVVNSPASGNLTDPVIFYMPENRQGNVEGITSEQDRNGLRAPKYASYLFLDGKYGENQYGFSTYFGDDMQGGNFDVNGNAYYRMHLQLGGPDPDDIRMSSLKIDVTEHFDTQLVLSSGAETEATVELSCSNYFNDEIKLICSATGANNVSKFQVFPLNDDGSLGTEVPNVSTSGGFSFVILETDDQPGRHTLRFKVRYTQWDHGDGGRTATIMFNLVTRFGTSIFHTHSLEIYS